MSSQSAQLVMGPIRFTFDGVAAPDVRYLGWAYRDFFGIGCVDDSSRVQVSLPVALMEGSPVFPPREPDFSAGHNWALWDEGAILRFCSGFADRPRPRFTCELDASMAACRLYVDGDLRDAPLRYPLDQVLAWGLLGRCQGLLVHAAGVVRDGAGYVLAGRSGAGKSTLSGFCQEEGWEVLNDDRVILHPDPRTGQWLVSGTPWHGSGCFARNRTVPLQGVYLLEQDLQDRTTLMADRDARMGLLDVASIAWFSESWSQATLDALTRLCKEVRVFRLHFRRSGAAVALLGEEMAA